MVEAQVLAYEMDHEKLPTDIDELESSGYLKEDQKACPNGSPILIGANGEVSTDGH